MKLATNAFCTGLPGAMWCHSTPRPSAQRRIAVEVSSVPLSLTTMAGFVPRSATSRSSSRATRRPPSEVSTTVASSAFRVARSPDLAGEVVHNARRPETPPVRERVRDGVAAERTHPSARAAWPRAAFRSDAVFEGAAGSAVAYV